MPGKVPKQRAFRPLRASEQIQSVWVKGDRKTGARYRRASIATSHRIEKRHDPSAPKNDHVEPNYGNPKETPTATDPSILPKELEPLDLHLEPQPALPCFFFADGGGCGRVLLQLFVEAVQGG